MIGHIIPYRDDFSGKADNGSHGSQHNQGADEAIFNRSRTPLRTPQPFASPDHRSEEHTSELQSLMRTSYAVFCLKKKQKLTNTKYTNNVFIYQQNHYTPSLSLTYKPTLIQ